MADYDWPDGEHRKLLGTRVSRVDGSAKTSAGKRMRASCVAKSYRRQVDRIKQKPRHLSRFLA